MQFIDGVNVLVFLHLIALALHLAENMTRALVSTKGIAQHAQSHLDAVGRSLALRQLAVQSCAMCLQGK